MQTAYFKKILMNLSTKFVGKESFFNRVFFHFFMKLRKVQNYWKYSKMYYKYQAMFAFISCKTIIIGVYFTKRRFMINFCSKTFFTLGKLVHIKMVMIH